MLVYRQNVRRTPEEYRLKPDLRRYGGKKKFMFHELIQIHLSCLTNYLRLKYSAREFSVFHSGNSAMEMITIKLMMLTTLFKHQ